MIKSPPKRVYPANKRYKAAPKAAKKKTKFSYNKTIINLGLGFPKRLISTLRYADTFTLTSTVGSLGKYQFVCNGLFDPNSTGGGNQPMYFDQLMALYDHYLVRKAKITVSLCTPVASLAYGVLINDDTTVTPGTILELQENSLGITTQVNVNSLPTKLTKYWNTWTYFGSSPEANDELHGSAAANPVEQSLFCIYMGTLDGSTATNVLFNILIEYEAEFFELKDISGS